MTPRPALHVHAADARPWLRQQSGARFDAISVDAYRQPYIPFYLTTREFFSEVRDHLSPRGVVLVNVGHPSSSERLEKVLSATMGTAFRTVLRDPVRSTNTVLLGTNTDASRASMHIATRAMPPDLAGVTAAAADRLAPALRGGSVYTDDRAPVEWLIDASIVKVAADGER